MAVKGFLITLISVAMVLRTSTQTKRGCAPNGFLDFEPPTEFMKAEDTELLGLYVLYSPRKTQKTRTLSTAMTSLNLVANDK